MLLLPSFYRNVMGKESWTGLPFGQIQDAKFGASVFGPLWLVQFWAQAYFPEIAARTLHDPAASLQGMPCN